MLHFLAQLHILAIERFQAGIQIGVSCLACVQQDRLLGLDLYYLVSNLVRACLLHMLASLGARSEYVGFVCARVR